MSTQLKCVIEDNRLVIFSGSPFAAWIKNVLKYNYKELVDDPKYPGARRTQVSVRTLYLESREDRPEWSHVLVTHQGMWHRVRLAAEAAGVIVHWLDQRRPFTKPDFKKMHGFRHSQRALTEQLLSADYSGLMEAPTRWGKTPVMGNVIRAFENVTCIAVVAPGADLVRQLAADIASMVPHREVIMLGGNSKKKMQGTDITVCSMDSMHKLSENTPLILIDEPHAIVTDGRLEDFKKFARARKLGFTATPEGRFDGRDILIEAFIGPILAQRTYLEAVAEGAICPIHVVVVMITTPAYFCPRRDIIYKKQFWLNPNVLAAAGWAVREAIPEEHQTLIFIANEEQAEAVAQYVGQDTQIAMAKRMTTKQRTSVATDMNVEGAITRVISSNIFAQGVTFHDLRVVLNMAGGGASTTAIQKPGRLAEIRPNKATGVMVDFMVNLPTGVIQTVSKCPVTRDCVARLALYRRKGYIVHMVRTQNEFKAAYARAVSNAAPINTI